MAITTLFSATLFQREAALAAPLALPQAVAAAIEHSPEKGQAEQRALAAEAVRDQAKREWLPKLTVEGVTGVRHLENDRRIALGLSSRDEYPIYGSLILDQPLFDMGRRTNEVRTQQARVSAARENTESVSQATAFAAARTYLEMLLYQRALAAAIDNRAFHEGMAADMREGLAQGMMNIAEQQQTDERLQAARVREAEARLDLQNARTDFVALTGISTDELILPESAAPALPASMDEAVALIAGANSRVREAEFTLAAAEAAVRRSRSDGGPSVDLRGTARTGRNYDGYRGRTNDYQALATVRMPLFDGGINAARVREAEHKAEEARFALAQVRRDIERQAREAWQRLTTWRIKFAEQEARARTAEDLLGSYRAQFGIGRRPLLDVLDAQQARYGATVDAEVSRFGALLSEYELLAAANHLVDYLGIPSRGPANEAYGPK